jgi:hypothetical protein
LEWTGSTSHVPVGIASAVVAVLIVLLSRTQIPWSKLVPGFQTDAPATVV